MNYEFHVGDYVETVDGIKGYISRVNDAATYGETLAYFVVTDRNNVPNAIGIGSESPIDELCYYKRIGKYDFSKKNKIEKLSLLLTSSDYNDTKAIIELGTKINELVDAVNELREKNDT